MLDWPYREGLRLDEAMHPLAIFATGMYGKPLPNQQGAPFRLVVPWKYGFKSIKGIVKIELTDTMSGVDLDGVRRPTNMASTPTSTRKSTIRVGHRQASDASARRAPANIACSTATKKKLRRSTRAWI